MIIGNSEDEKRRQQIFSLAQDVIHVASGGTKLTPKHVGLASTVHHATRNKALVQLLHAAGHCASYETVEKTETTIAKQEIERWQLNNNLVVPVNLVPGKFVQFAGDNININVETLDGKGMFNGTQYAAFQHTTSSNQDNVPGKVIGTQRSFGPSVPPDFHEMLPSQYNRNKRPAPIFSNMEMDWYSPRGDLLNNAKTMDMSWLLCRMNGSADDGQKVPAWTGFNKVVSTFQSDAIEVGYMPIIPSPADEMDTVFTELARVKAVSEHLGQKHTVITFDQALYYRAKEICWLKPDQFENVIVRLGGFHTMMNFMKCIGQHMDSSGLKDIWIESGVFGENSTTHMLTGHAYNKAVRGHKLTFEALWRILWPKFLSWMEENGHSLSDDLQTCVDHVTECFITENGEVQDSFAELVTTATGIFPFLEEFDNSKAENPTFIYWREYMAMVSILLGFLRAEREGNWGLHLETLSKMLPWFAVYDHINYSRWGPVYLADMMQLPTTAPEVHAEFVAGRFSVKRSERKFSQISTDQALEHVNKVSKVSGGIVGITHLDSTRDRWCLTYNERARISDDTLSLYDLQHDDTNSDWRHRDMGPAGLKRDELDVEKLKHEFIKFKVFSNPDGELMSLSTGDVGPDDIRKDVLTAETKGEDLVKDFVKDRLMEDSATNFYARIPQNKSKTLGTMYKVHVKVKKNKVVVVKAERDIFRRLLVVSGGGRNVDLANILQYELSPVPLALAGMNHKLHTTNKSVLAEILSQLIEVETKLPKSDLSSCLLIDGHALIQALGKPDDARTFGDLADIFFNNIRRRFDAGFARVDVVFDRYFDSSIKDGTRSNRVGTARPIRRIIDSRDVKLPQNWAKFIGHSSNKAELASFISNEICAKTDQVPVRCELVLGGGFSEMTTAWSSTRQAIPMLHCTHEEADTRLLLHAKDAECVGHERTVIKARDTDVLVIALGHRDQLSKEVWMSTGTMKDPKFIPVHSIDVPSPLIKNLMAYHAVTGCDTTSQFSGKGKKTTWKVFQEKSELLKEIGQSAKCTEEGLIQSEQFICHVYGHGDLRSINEVRMKMFVRGKCSVDALPPTQDALHFHLKRANYQAFIWKQALTPDPNLPSPNGCGWTMEKGSLKPVLMSLEPVPKSCNELVSCSCKSGCGSGRCGCLKNKLQCTSACKCEGLCQNEEMN